MVTVRLTRHLRRFLPHLDEGPIQVEAGTVAAVIRSLGESFPGLRDYILDDGGALRQHVNVFVDGELIGDRLHLSDAVGADSQVFIMQALSGGREAG